MEWLVVQLLQAGLEGMRSALGHRIGRRNSQSKAHSWSETVQATANNITATLMLSCFSASTCSRLSSKQRACAAGVAP